MLTCTNACSCLLCGALKRLQLHTRRSRAEQCIVAQRFPSDVKPGEEMAINTSNGVFADYVRIWEVWLHSEAYRICKNAHDADDLVQATLLKIYNRWETLEDHDQLKAYIRRTLVSTFLSERRRPRWKHEFSYAEPPDSADVRQLSVDRMMLVTAVGRLGPRQRAVIVLRFWGDLSVEQTASMLGCSAGTVTSQTHRALTTLRRHVGQFER